MAEGGRLRLVSIDFRMIVWANLLLHLSGRSWAARGLRLAPPASCDPLRAKGCRSYPVALSVMVNLERAHANAGRFPTKLIGPS